MARTTILLPSLAGLAALALVGCNQTGAPASSASGVTPSSFRMPDESGCAGAVGRFRAVVDNDVRIGHLNRAVHDAMSAEIDRAAATCTAGRDADAVRMISATRSRYGYR